MLSPIKEKSAFIEKVERKEDRLFLYSDAGIHRIEPKNNRTVRITYTQEKEFSKKKKPGICFQEVYAGWNYVEEEHKIRFSMEHLEIVIDRESASYTYYDGEGNLLLKERERDSKRLEEFTTYQLLEENMSIERIATADGIKEVVKDAARIPTGKSFHTRLSLEWAEQEALYGLGQHEEGFASLRGQTVYLHQANRKIAIPMLVSAFGYGILVDTYSPMIFSDSQYGSYLYTEADPEMDFYFLNGGTMDGVIREYRILTGKAALLPKWAYGYLQSQERYETEQEILGVAEGYRKRGIGLDGIILDWCSWEDNQWGQKTLDQSRFPDAGKMIEKLHDNHVHFMISIWPNMEKITENYREFKEKSLFLPGCSIYNALSKEGRDLYWNQVRKGLAVHGIDAWWCDSSEPFTPEWNHTERVEPSRMYQEYCQTAGEHLPAEQMNAFALYHAQCIYEGQRADSEKRVVNLTRSASIGQQRYGTILWSGDTEASWDTLRKQIAAGLHFCASGLPFWTTDIGAFFVKRGNVWYWKGDYDQGTEDLGYRELFVRWYQWGCFLPVFRGHGTDCRRELWNFANTEVLFYDALLTANRLRYEFMPYIYSYAGLCWYSDFSMIRMLAFAYPDDPDVWNLMDQYMFGNEIMVCPVTHPMYFERGSRALLDTAEKRRVYLPKGNGWYDYWTRQYYEGGSWIEAETPINRIPLFIREGSILPKAKPACSVEEQEPKLDIVIYTGKDASFTLYEDEGDGYGYEQGRFQLTEFVWEEEKRCFHAGKSKEKQHWEGMQKQYEICKVEVITNQQECYVLNDYGNGTWGEEKIFHERNMCDK